MRNRKRDWRHLLSGVGVLWLSVAAVAGDLTAELKKELARIEQKITATESSIGVVERAGIDLSVREIDDWIKSFMLDAELSEADAAIVKLRNRVKAIGERAVTAEKKMAAEIQQKARPATAKRAEPTGIKLPVDMKNVSFKRDVAPIVASVCVRCHNPNQKSGKFDASTYATFKTQLEPGDPDSSHLLLLVTGQAEPRMPRGGQTRFSKEWADVWTAWIKQGAKFDGPKADAPIASYLIDFDSQRREAVAKMSDADLQKLHRETAKRQMDVAKPKRPAVFLESPHFVIHATLDSADAEYVSALAEATVEELSKRFGSEKTSKVFRGKLGLNVFTDRPDFTAFCQQIDRYQPEPQEYAHVGISLEHQHVAVFANEPGRDLDERVAEFVALAFLQQLNAGKLPPWAAHGYAKTVAASLASKGGSRNEQLAKAAHLLAEGKTLKDLLTEKLPWADLEPLAASFFQFLNQAYRKRAPAFLEALSKSGAADREIREVLKSDPDALTKSWLAWSKSKSTRKR